MKQSYSLKLSIMIHRSQVLHIYSTSLSIQQSHNLASPSVPLPPITFSRPPLTHHSTPPSPDSELTTSQTLFQTPFSCSPPRHFTFKLNKSNQNPISSFSIQGRQSTNARK